MGVVCLHHTLRQRCDSSLQVSHEMSHLVCLHFFMFQPPQALSGACQPLCTVAKTCGCMPASCLSAVAGDKGWMEEVLTTLDKVGVVDAKVV